MRRAEAEGRGQRAEGGQTGNGGRGGEREDTAAAAAAAARGQPAAAAGSQNRRRERLGSLGQFASCPKRVPPLRYTHDQGRVQYLDISMGRPGILYSTGHSAPWKESTAT